MSKKINLQPSFANSEIVWIPVEDLSPDKKRVEEELPRDSSLVVDSIKLKGYHPDAPPLIAFENLYLPGKFNIVEGIARYEGALQNPSITKLPCRVLKNLKPVEARKIAARQNSFVHNIRKSTTLAQAIVESLDEAHKCRPKRKNIILTADEFSLLRKQTQKSTKTLNRALNVLRKIICELVESDSQTLSGGVRICIENTVKNNIYCELTNFYLGKICPSTFEQIFLKRNKPHNEEASNKPCDGQELPADEIILDAVEPVSKAVENSFLIAYPTLNEPQYIHEFITRIKSASLDAKQLPLKIRRATQDFLEKSPEEINWLKPLAETIFSLDEVKTNEKRIARAKPANDFASGNQPELFKIFHDGDTNVS